MNRYAPLILLAGSMLLSQLSLAVCNNLLDYESRKLRSDETINLCQAYQGKVILAVNTASKCGYTPQFKELEALYQKYADRGLAVVGFPSNDFRQEHQDEAKAADVCYINYGVTFQMMAPSSVKGEQANAFFKALADASGQAPQWNFNKYLIDRNGKVLAHYPSRSKPLDGEIEQAISAALDN